MFYRIFASTEANPDCKCSECGADACAAPDGRELCGPCLEDELVDVEVCPAHNVALGEGAPCHVCEDLAHKQLCDEAFAYIDNVVRGYRINHVNQRLRTPGQHIAFLCICLSPYGASVNQIIEIMRLRDIPGSNETVEAIMEYLK